MVITVVFDSETQTIKMLSPVGIKRSVPVTDSRRAPASTGMHCYNCSESLYSDMLACPVCGYRTLRAAA